MVDQHIVYNQQRAQLVWCRTWDASAIGDITYELDHFALDAEQACYRVARAILIIDRELGEGDDE